MLLLIFFYKSDEIIKASSCKRMCNFLIYKWEHRKLKTNRRWRKTSIHRKFLKGVLTCPSKEAIQAPVWTRGPSLPRAKPPPTDPMLPNIYIPWKHTNFKTYIAWTSENYCRAPPGKCHQTFPIRVRKRRIPWVSIPALRK